VANAVDLADHPAITRRPACEMQADSDLGERPVTVEEGTNVLFSGTIDALEPAVREQLSRPRAQHQVPEYWDGQAAERIVAVFQQLAHV
jgi:UDP-N-acetylglucosamine 2-epimerase